MLEPVKATLSALRDVSGIEGSFLISDSGYLMAQEMPSIFDSGILKEVCPRLSRLPETFMSAGDELDSCLIRFNDYLLYVRVVFKGVLCILTKASVNIPALRMAVNLAQRRVSADLQRLPQEAFSAAVAAPVPVPTPVQPAFSAPPPPQQPQVPAFAAPKRVRMYRGQIIEE